MGDRLKLAFFATRNHGERVLETFFLKSWWVCLFMAFCYLIYSHGMHKKMQAYSELTMHLKKLEAERIFVLQEQEDLLLQVQSENDPAWVEMVLMKKLGVVPEGQIKVYFEKCF